MGLQCRHGGDGGKREIGKENGKKHYTHLGLNDPSSQ
jgi:hypothetical protein